MEKNDILNIIQDIKEIISYGIETDIKITKYVKNKIKDIEINEDGDIENLIRDIKELVLYGLNGKIWLSEKLNNRLNSIDIDKIIFNDYE